MKIAVYYHCLFYGGEPTALLPAATRIVLEQMAALKQSGLLESADRFVVGVNGGNESDERIKLCIPAKAEVIRHGLESRAENLTIMHLWRWVQSLPGDDDWAILYFHSKGCTHPPDSDYAKFAGRWRKSMEKYCVSNWRQCVSDLKAGNDVACTYWMWNLADGTQHIPAGNFLWTKASFVRKLPSMMLRERIKSDGIAALSSRYEAEVCWGNGPKPIVKTYGIQGLGGEE